MESKYSYLQGFRNLITDKSARWSCVEFGDFWYQNRKFRWKTTVFDLLGKLIDETEDMSSDTYHEEIEENKEEEKHDHDDDDDIFYDSLDWKMSLKFKFCSDSVENIVP